MSHYKVTDPAGFYDGRTRHAPGQVIPLAPGARRDAALHFKQVESVKEEAPPPEPKPKAARP